MESVLRKLNLGTLIDKFKEERVDEEIIVSATDNELIRLWVTTISDRIRLREECKKLKKSELASSSGLSFMRASLQERIFTSTSGKQRGSNSKNRKRNKYHSFTVNFMCLADSFSSKTPTSIEKQILFKAGLGAKKIKFDMEDNEKTVVAKITSDSKGDNGKPLGFPALNESGGFEMMQCLPNCRDLAAIDCNWNAADLKASLGGGQGKIYLVPIQKSLFSNDYSS